jgi:hypothetical protein
VAVVVVCEEPAIRDAVDSAVALRDHAEVAEPSPSLVVTDCFGMLQHELERRELPLGIPIERRVQRPLDVLEVAGDCRPDAYGWWIQRPTPP